MDSLEVAKYIINRAIAKEKPISNLQLQKILYFSHLEYLKQEKTKLIDDNFEAWDFGPVVRRVYNKFCIWGAGKLALMEETNVKKLSIDESIDGLIDIPAWKLVEKSHNKKGAWAKVYQDGEKNIIPDEYIKQEADEYNIFAI